MGHHAESEANNLLKGQLAHAIRTRGLTIQQAAALLNMSSERLYKCLNQGIPNSFPADALSLFALRIDPTPLLDINRDAQLIASQRPQFLPETPDEFREVEAQILRAQAAVIDIGSFVSKGEEIPPSQLRQIRRAIEKAITALLSVQLVTEALAPAHEPAQPGDAA